MHGLRPSIAAIVSLAALSLCLTIPAGAFVHQFESISIPVRDGKSLAADLYRPADTGKWPTILIQTPYDRKLYRLVFRFEISQDPLLKSPNYAFLIADWRGFYDSAPAAVPGYDRGYDGYDLVEWIAAQDWSNGNVGTWGASALGQIQFQTAARQPPHLKVCVPMVGHARQTYDLYYGGGVYYENKNSFVAGYFGLGFVLKDHPLYDPVWQFAEANALPLGQCNVPMLHISGWYDHQTDISIREFRNLQESGGALAKGRQKMMIGPWSHSHVGDLKQGQIYYPAAYQESSRMALECYEYYLRGLANGFAFRSPLLYFQINEDRWLATEDWPPASTRKDTYYLTSQGGLAKDAPTSASALKEYVSDPANPVPTRFGAILLEDDSTTQGPGDLTEVENRPDVLTFTTPPLVDPLRIMGRSEALLHISADVPDADLAVRMCQVTPEGKSLLLVDGIQRASLRGSYAQKKLLQPQEIVLIRVSLPSVAATISPGHRLRVTVASSNYNCFSINPQDGSSFTDDAGASLQKGTIRLHASASYPSQIRLPLAVQARAETWPLYGRRMERVPW